MRLTFGINVHTKTYLKRITIIGLWLISVAVSFCAGAFFIYEYGVFGAKITCTMVRTTEHPIVYPLYGVDDYIRANDDVKAYLSQEQQKPEFCNLRPLFIVVPQESGYTIYSSSGVRGADLPEKLYDSTLEVVRKSLRENKAKPISSDAE